MDVPIHGIALLRISWFCNLLTSNILQRSPKLLHILNGKLFFNYEFPFKLLITGLSDQEDDTVNTTDVDSYMFIGEIYYYNHVYYIFTCQ